MRPAQECARFARQTPFASARVGAYGEVSPNPNGVNTMKTLALACAAASLGLALAIPAQAHQLGTPEMRARAAAAQGPEALRRFVWRTRMIYGLDIRDFARFVASGA